MEPLTSSQLSFLHLSISLAVIKFRTDSPLTFLSENWRDVARRLNLKDVVHERKRKTKALWVYYKQKSPVEAKFRAQRKEELEQTEKNKGAC